MNSTHLNFQKNNIEKENNEKDIVDKRIETNNCIIKNLYININYFNSNFIYLDYNHYLRKELIYILYKSPSIYLNGIYLKLNSNLLNFEIDNSEKHNNETYNSDKNIIMSNYKEHIVKDNKIQQNTTKYIKHQNYKLKINLDKNNSFDKIVIDKLIECNSKLFTMLKHNVNFKRKNIQHKINSPINRKTELPTLKYNELIKPISNNMYQICITCNQKKYNLFKDELNNLNYNSIFNQNKPILDNSIKNKEFKNIKFSISKITIKEEIKPIIELISIS